MTLIFQKLKNINLSPGVITLLFFLCPPSMLYFIIKDCYRCKHYAFILFSIFVGLMGMLMTFPYGDHYRIALSFYEMKDMSYEEALFSTFIRGKFDIILPSLEYLFSHLGISFGFIRLIFSSVAFYFFLLLYEFYTQLNKKNSSNKIIFWAIVLTLPFATICNGLRFGLASCLFIYYVIKRHLFAQNNISDYIILAISIFTHMSILMFVLLLPLCNYMKFTNRLIMFNVGIICAILSSVFYIFLNKISILGGNDFQNYLSEYTIGTYSTSEYAIKGLNIWGLLKAIAGQYILFIINIYFIVKKFPINKRTGILYLLFFLYLLTFSLSSINGRVMFLFNILGIFYILYYSPDYRKFILQTILMVTLLNTVLSWRLTSQLRNYYIFYPIPIAVSGDYDEQWILTHNDKDGVPWIYK